MLSFLCRCSYLFKFLLSSQFYWHIHLKSTAYFLDPPCTADVWKILESACVNSWSPRVQRVNFALFGAHSRKYMSRLWSENIVTSVAKTKLLNFRKWVKWAMIPIFCTRLYIEFFYTAANDIFFQVFFVDDLTYINWHLKVFKFIDKQKTIQQY